MKITETQLRKVIRKLITENKDKNKGGNIASIHIGDVLYDEKDNKITIDDIYVGVITPSGHPSTWVSYRYETVDGRSGSEKNELSNLIRILTEK